MLGNGEISSRGYRKTERENDSLLVRGKGRSPSPRVKKFKVKNSIMPWFKPIHNPDKEEQLIGQSRGTLL